MSKKKKPNYQSVRKHERITKVMRFIEEHPGTKIEDLTAMVSHSVFRGRHTSEKIQAYFWDLVRLGDMYTSGGKIYPTPVEESQ